MSESPAASVRQRIQSDELLFDSAVVSHGFVPFLRDYDVVIEVPADRRDGSGRSYIQGRYRYRFTHCAEAVARSTVRPEVWQRSWDDVFTDYEAWEAAGTPEGYVWGVCWADAYPGMSYVEDSEPARRWTELLGHEMHEVSIETNALALTLVFHGLRVDQLAVGDPATDSLKPVPERHAFTFEDPRAGAVWAQVSRADGDLAVRLVISLARSWDVDLRLDVANAQSFASALTSGVLHVVAAQSVDGGAATLTYEPDRITVSIPDEGFDGSVELGAHAGVLARALANVLVDMTTPADDIGGA